ncbi:hypothetical protein GGX14DRAFT_482963 [Mycena pura]|uniref:F-box domain-containing protein n=1 Tax=Mycena pura TaxID=153505 RepID=A0AAD6URM0_9AGAR|nr:hypothetical protein GGX14DRAFT_482963 [Mycena pura]
MSTCSSDSDASPDPLRRSTSPTPFSLPFSLDITHLVTSNDTPLDSEDVAIRSTISTLRERLELPSGLIGDLDKASRSTDPSIIRHLISKRLAVVSPFRRIPADIIYEIFIEVYNSTEFNGPPHPLWHLGHICRFWRAVAISCPHLWNCINVEIIDPSADALDRLNPLSKIEIQYSRSANLPIKMALTSWPLLKDVDSAWLTGFFSGSDRWSSLRVRCSSTAFEALRPLHGRLPLLRRLEVLAFEYNRAPQALADIFAVAPQLTEVILTDENCEMLSPQITLPWRQLTVYRGMYDFSDQLELLQALPNATDCTLGFSSAVTAPLTSGKVTRRWHRLHLSSPRYFLTWLTAPALEELHLRGEVSAPSLYSFFPRSACQLTALVWDRVLFYHSPGEQLGDVPPPAFLRTLPCLRRLVIRPRPQHEDDPPLERHALFDALAACGPGTDADAELCPALVELACDDAYVVTNAVLVSKLLGMVEARLRNTRLVSFRLALGGRTAPPSLAARVERLAHGGRDVALVLKLK